MVLVKIGSDNGIGVYDAVNKIIQNIPQYIMYWNALDFTIKAIWKMIYLE